MSGRQKGESSNGAADKKNSNRPSGGDKKNRKQRSTDIGRALRTIYDDTLRESVPDDFRDLLGKLG